MDKEASNANGYTWMANTFQKVDGTDTKLSDLSFKENLAPSAAKLYLLSKTGATLVDENGNENPLIKPTKQEVDEMWENHVKMVNKARKNKFMAEKIRKNDEEHYYISLLYLLMTKSNYATEHLMAKPPAKTLVAEIVKEMNGIYNKFTTKEKKRVRQIMKKYYSWWKVRLKEKDYSKREVQFNLHCCNLDKFSLSKTKVKECEFEI